MKVAMITPFPESDLKIQGGVAGVSYYLSSSMIHNFPELELHIVVPNYQGQFRVEEMSGIKIHHLPMPKYIPAALAGITLFGKDLAIYLSKMRPDIAHFQGSASWGYHYKGPKVLTIHGIPERDILFNRGHFRKGKAFLLGLLEKISRSDFKHTIVINQYVLNIVGNQLGSDRRLIANPIDEKFFSIKRCERESTILYGGVICQRKNVMGVLSAFRKVLDRVPRARLLIAGSCPERGYLDKCLSFVSAHGMTDKVNFLGSLSVAQMQDLFATVSGVVLLSYQETAPLILAEAMAAGIPVVASNICGMPYMIKDGHSGFLVDPNDIDSAAQFLVQILENPVLATRLGSEARQYALDNHHPSVVARETYRLYEDVTVKRA